MNPKIIKIAVTTFLLVVLVIAVGWFLVNYQFIDGKVVKKSSDIEYAQLEQDFEQSYVSGDIAMQVSLAEKMRSTGLDNYSADLYMAEALLQKGSLEYDENVNADKAIEILTALLSQRDDDPGVYSAMGYAYEIKQDYSKAFEYYNKAIDLNPNDDDTLYLRRGHAYDLTGDTVLAKNDYLKAYSIDSENESTKINLASIYYGEGKAEEAFKLAEELLATGKNAYIKATASDLIGLMAIDDEKYDSAIQYFDYAVNIYPDYPNSYLNYAYATLLKSESIKSVEEKNILLANAEEDIKIAVELHSKSSFAVVLMGLVADIRGDSKTAKALYTKALSMVDDDISLGKTEKDSMKAQINSLLKK